MVAVLGEVLLGQLGECHVHLISARMPRWARHCSDEDLEKLISAGSTPAR